MFPPIAKMDAFVDATGTVAAAPVAAVQTTAPVVSSSALTVPEASMIARIDLLTESTGPRGEVMGRDHDGGHAVPRVQVVGIATTELPNVATKWLVARETAP